VIDVSIDEGERTEFDTLIVKATKQEEESSSIYMTIEKRQRGWNAAEVADVGCLGDRVRTSKDGTVYHDKCERENESGRSKSEKSINLQLLIRDVGSERIPRIFRIEFGRIDKAIGVRELAGTGSESLVTTPFSPTIAEPNLWRRGETMREKLIKRSDYEKAC
jgi:hypothetical protein